MARQPGSRQHVESRSARGRGPTTLYRMMERHELQRSPAAGWVVEREAETPAEPEALELVRSTVANAREA